MAKAQILSVSPYHWEWEGVWTLEARVKGPFNTNKVLEPEQWKQLISNSLGEVRHAPHNEKEAQLIADKLNRLIEKGDRQFVIDTSFGNVRYNGMEKTEKRKTKEERKTMAELGKRKQTISVTVNKGERTYGHTIWDLERLAMAMAQGLIPKDRDGMEALLGVKVLRKELRIIKKPTRNEDTGVEELISTEVEVPVWDEKALRVGLNEDEFPEPSDENGIIFDERVRTIFGKAKGKLPFECQKVKDSEIVLIFAVGIDVKAARSWISYCIEKLPWLEEPKGSDSDDKMFGG